MKTDKLCKCNNCDTILIDENPDVNAPEFILKGREEAMIKDANGFWACPKCETDSNLIDLQNTPDYSGYVLATQKAL